MDNNRNYDAQRPRKKVSRQTMRVRRLVALLVIALLVLILVILACKACSPKTDNKGGKDSKSKTTTTTTTAVTTTMPVPTTTIIVTTVPTTTEPVNNSDFKLDKYSFEFAVGETQMPRVLEHPEGSGEWNEMWSSSDENIATVDQYGNIKAVAPGSCQIILRDGGDQTQEVQIQITVIGSPNATTTTTANGLTADPQSTAMSAPAPAKISDPTAHYEGNTLIVNKSYPLSSSYNPNGLDPTCEEWFYKLVSAAAKEGINIFLSSGFRSYDLQQSIYNNYVNESGQAAADTFSARPGFSEHQTGLALDVNTIDDSFAGTPEAIWLENHCYEYGFIIRYPLGKDAITGYKYEPWHIRYVGSDVANQIHAMGENATLEELYNVNSQYAE